MRMLEFEVDSREQHLVAGPGQEQGAVQLVSDVEEWGARQHHAPRRHLPPAHLLLQQEAFVSYSERGGGGGGGGGGIAIQA